MRERSLQLALPANCRTGARTNPPLRLKWETTLSGMALPEWPDMSKLTMSDDGKQMVVASARPARTLVEMVKWIDMHGLGLVDIHLKRPTLEDVFIEMTGKKLRD